MCLIERERTADFLKSFQSVYDECGKLPIWELQGYETNCMIGYNSVSVIADALSKGIAGVDYARLLDAMLASSKKHEYGLDSFYDDRAVIADKEHESVSKSLEYAYDAWCVAKTAEALGRNAEKDEYLGYASYWRNIFDPSTGFMRPRLNGRWLTPFNPREVNNHFTEANSWQYSFFVPQDISGHIAALGGDEAYAAKIDALFDAPEETAGRTQADITGQIGQYAHGNEPSHHIPYLYNYAGQPWKTQERVRQILSTLYTSAPDGLCGNEDCAFLLRHHHGVLLFAGAFPPGAEQGIGRSARAAAARARARRLRRPALRECDERRASGHSDADLPDRFLLPQEVRVFQDRQDP